MLDKNDVAFVEAHFNIYDHNWRFYQELLGEAFLINEVIAYYDGAGLYLAAFALGDSTREFSSANIKAFIDKGFGLLPKADIKFVDIWGRFEDLAPNYVSPYGASYELCEQSGTFETMFDSIFDLQAFDQAPTKAARKRIRQFRNSGIETAVKKLPAFDLEHMGLLDIWLEGHPDVSPVHREFFAALPEYIKSDGVFVCEARLDAKLVGFSVIGIVSGERMILHSAFPLRKTGARAGDALFLASLDFARQHNIRWLHVGYSASESLLASKESWGAMSRSLPFREAFYAINMETGRMIEKGRFLRRMRAQDQELSS